MSPSSVRGPVGYFAVIIECLGFVFNLLTLYLIKRQGFRSFDMWLALISTICDIILVSLKFSQWVFLISTHQFEIFNNQIFIQLDGFATSFFTSTSILCIGFLALLRWWAIVKARRVIFRNWAISFIVPQLILGSLLVIVALNKNFVLMPFERYFFPNAESNNIITLITIAMLCLWCLFSIIVVNTCYPLIAWSYLSQDENDPRLFGCSPRELAQEHFRQKVLLVSKMVGLLLIYNLTMVTPLVIAFKELIQQKIRSHIGDSFFGFSLLLLTLVNPLTLILLHQDTSSDLKYLINSICNPKHHSKIDLLSHQNSDK